MVRLPDNLSTDPYLFELYGTVEWSSRNLFNGILVGLMETQQIFTLLKKVS